MKEQFYIYGIIKNSGNTALAKLVGIDRQKVILMPYKELLVAASRIGIDNFGGLGEEELKAMVAVHEKVNEELIKDFNVIPMKFGMIVEGREKLFDFLLEIRPQFLEALEKIDGKAEFVVETLWDEKKIIEDIVKENSEARELKQKAESQGKFFGLPAKIKLGKLIFNNLESRRKQYTQEILDFLKNYSSDHSEGKLFNKEAITSYSFLINKSQEFDFESRLNQLAEKYQNKLRFKYIGPMAPYSFANIIFASASKESVNEARKILGVGKKATFPEIKIAYHNLAGKYHPDKNSESQEAEEQIKKIIQAYKLLEKVCKKETLETKD